MFSKIRKPETVTLRHYNVIFKDAEGNEHTYSSMAYIDTDEISCSALEFFLVGVEFIQDDAGVLYPLSNIIWIKQDLDDIIKAIKIDNQIWYQRKHIKIAD